MHVLVATDAWHPQINGVVRTLEATAASAARLGVRIAFLTPEGLPSFALPSYPGLRCALPFGARLARHLDDPLPDAIHIATEGPIGWTLRRLCRIRGLAFTTSFHTHFPEYVAARLPVPLAWSYAALRRFHAPAAATMVATPSLRATLTARGFGHLRSWSRGVDTALFHPGAAAPLDWPRPIFLTVGRIAVEKNLEAFLRLDLPGTKLVVGEGPQEAELRSRFPAARFLGPRSGRDLAALFAAADVFVFPSRTDTFGIVQLEALASGVPVAAFPVPGPRDLIGDAPVGVLDHDLRRACLAALELSRTACRAYAERFSWESCTRQFLSNLVPTRQGGATFPMARPA